MARYSPEYPKIASLEYLCNTSKNGGRKFIFCIQTNIKLSYNLIPLILVGMASPAQITKNPKLPKIASLQSLHYLNKEMRDEVDFCAMNIDPTSFTENQKNFISAGVFKHMSHRFMSG